MNVECPACHGEGVSLTGSWCRRCGGSGYVPAPAPKATAASMLVLDYAGRVLLLRRSTTDLWRPGSWDLPGGRRDGRESIKRTAIREAREEAGIISWNLEQVGTLRNGQHAVFQALTWRNMQKRGIRLSHEHDAYRWVAAAYGNWPAEPLVPGLKPLLTRLM